MIPKYKVGDKFTSSLNNMLTIIHVDNTVVILQINKSKERLSVPYLIALNNILLGHWKPINTTYKEEL
tara:strand:- start:6673 stop:6876 length:204 start_codon:yes stop_codon:yes gene_type:complete